MILFRHMDTLVKQIATPYAWDCSPERNQRDETGYVGLLNLGSTCYMNSVLQQVLFFFLLYKLQLYVSHSLQIYFFLPLSWVYTMAWFLSKKVQHHSSNLEISKQNFFTSTWEIFLTERYSFFHLSVRAFFSQRIYCCLQKKKFISQKEQ